LAAPTGGPRSRLGQWAVAALLALASLGQQAWALSGPVQSLPTDNPWALSSTTTFQNGDLTTGAVLGKYNGNPAVSGTAMFVGYSGSSTYGAQVFWGPVWAGLSLDGTDIAGNEMLIYSPGYSSLNSGYVEYRGTTTIYIWNGSYYQAYGLYSRMKMTVTLNNSPVALVEGGTVGASAPVVFRLSRGSNYKVALAMEIYWNGSWQPAVSFYDGQHTPSWHATQYSLSYGYYYQRGPSSISLAQNTINENSDGAVYAGKLTANDLDSTAITYAITSDPSGLFAVSGDELWAGRGFNSTYFSDIGLSRVYQTKTDRFIDNGWGVNQPIPGLGPNNISFRWTGRVYAPATDTYTFRTITDDGVRLYLNGVSAINDWNYHGDTANYSSLILNKGQAVDIDMQGFQGGGGDTMRLAWTRASSGVYKPLPGGTSGNPFFDYETQAQYPITVTATDSAGQSVSQNILVGITDVNEPPIVLSTIPGLTVQEDFTPAVSVNNLGNYFKDPELRTMHFSYAMNPPGKLTFTTNVTGTTMTFSPVPNANGTVTVTVTAHDDINQTASTSFNVTINPVDDAPGIAKTFANSTANYEDQTYLTMDVSSYFTDIDGYGINYSVTGIKTHPGGVSTNVVAAWVDGTTLTVAGGPNVNGGFDITVQAQEAKPGGGGLSTSQVLYVLLNPVNDPPALTTGILGGGLTREVYLGIPGTDVEPFRSGTTTPKAAFTNLLTAAFESPANVYDNYAQKVHGYLAPPVSGNYTFYIAADDTAQLWLNSSGTATSGAQKIASVPSAVGFRNWTAFAAQRSASVNLQAGQFYYIAAYMKEGGGADFLSVRWVRPDGVDQGPIPAQFLRPFGTTPAAPTLPGFTTLVNGTATVTVAEDAGPILIDSFGTGLTEGAPDEASSDTITNGVVSIDNPTLFTAGPSLVVDQVNHKLSLSFKSAPNGYGTANVTFQMGDNMGTSNGGANVAQLPPISIVVTPVNDPPSCATIPNLIVDEQPVPTTLGTNLIAVVVTNVTGGPFEGADIVTNSSKVLSSIVNIGTDLIKFDHSSATTTTGTNATFTLFYDLVPYRYGTSTVQVVLMDNGAGPNNAVTNQFTIKVNQVHHFPIIGAADSVPTNHLVLNEDTVGYVVSLTNAFLDLDGDPFTLLTVTTSNSGLLQASAGSPLNTSLTPGLGIQGYLTLNCQPNQFTARAGTNDAPVTVTYTAVAFGNPITNSFTVTINEVNDPPTMDDIGTIITVDNGFTRVPITGLGPGPLEDLFDNIDTNSFLFTSSSNIVSASTMFMTNIALAPGGQGTAELRFSPKIPSTGTSLLSVSVADKRGARTTKTFNVQVNHVNHAPVIVNPLPPIFANAPLTGANLPTLSILEDSPVTLLDLSTLFIDPDGDALTLSIFANTNSAVLQAFITNSPTTLALVPAPDLNGRSELTIRATDGLDESFFAFAVQVVPVNDAPYFDPMTRQRVSEDSGAQQFQITGIRTGPGNESTQHIKSFTATVLDQTDPALLSNVSIVYADGTNTPVGPQATLTYQLGQDVNGSGHIHVVLQDDGGTNNGGIDSFSRDVLIVVDPINHAPRLAGHAGTVAVNEDQYASASGRLLLDFTGLFVNFRDPTPPDLVLGAINDPSGIFQKVTGSVRVPPDSPQSLQVTFNPDAFGTATVQLNAFGAGLISSASDTLTVVVLPVNDPPAADPIPDQFLQQGAANYQVTLNHLRTGPANESNQKIKSVTAAVVAQTIDGLVVIDGVDLPSSPTNATVRYHLGDNIAGEAHVRVTIVDDGGTDRGGVDTSTLDFFVFVAPVQTKAKLVRALPLIQVLEDQFISTGYITDVDLTGYFRDPDGNGVQLLIRGITDANDVLDDSFVAIEPTDQELVRLRFKPDAYGDASITLAARANGLVSDDTGILRIKVLPVNDAPSFDQPADMIVEQGRASNVVNITGFQTGPRESGQKITNVTAQVIAQTKAGLVTLISGPPFTPGQTNTQIAFSTATNRTGFATIRVTITDDGGTDNGGINTSYDDFGVAVVQSPLPPSLIAPSNFFQFAEADLLVNPVRLLFLTNAFLAPNAAPMTLFIDSIDDVNGLIDQTQTSFAPTDPESLQVTFNTNLSGVVTLRIRASANRLTAPAIHVVTITVTPTDLIPTLNPIFRQVVTINSGEHDVNLTGISPGPNEGADQTTTVTAVVTAETNPGMVQDLSVDHDPQGGVAVLHYTVKPATTGTSTVRVTVSDGVNSLTREFHIVVVDGDHPPVALRTSGTFTLLENQFASTGDVGDIDLRGFFFDDSGIAIQLIVDQASIVDTNHILATEVEIPHSSPINSEFLRARFHQDVNGGVTFNVSPIASGLVSSNFATIHLDVLPVNHPPVITSVSNVTVLEDSGPVSVTVNLGAAGPADEAAQRIIAVTAVPADSASAALIQSPITVTFNPGDSVAHLSLTPAAHHSGVAFVTVSAQDNGGTANGGVDTTTATFSFTVTHVSHPPVLAPGMDHLFFGLTSDQLEPLSYRPVLTFDQLFDNPDNDPIALVVLSRHNADGILDDSQPDVVAPVPSDPLALRIRLVPGAFGRAELDIGGVANGVFSTNFSRVVIEVTPPLGAPSFDAISDVSFLQGTAPPAIQLTHLRPGSLTSGASNIVSIQAHAVSSNPSGLISSFTVTRGTNPASATLTFVPAPGLVGDATVAVDIQDDGTVSDTRVNTFERQFNVHIVGREHLPFATTNAVQFVFKENQFVGSGRSTRLDLSGLFVAPDGGAINLVLLTSALDDPQNVLEDELGRVYVDPLNPQSVLVGFHQDAFGQATLRFVASANGLQSSDVLTVNIQVLPVNISPSLDAPIPVVLTDPVTEIVVPITGISAGPASESGQKVTSLSAGIVRQTPTNLVQISGVDYIAGMPTGAVHLAILPGVLIGSARLKVTIQDDGGVANGGVDTTTVQFDLAVNIARKPPVLVSPIGTRRLLEDSLSGAGNLLQVSLDGVFQSQFGGSPILNVTSIDDPDDILADERADGVVLTNTSPPTLRILLRADGFGTAHISYNALAGGLFSTNSDTLTIIVDPVNDAPSFSAPSTLKLAQGPSNVVFRVSNLNVGPRESKVQSILSVKATVLDSTPTDLLPGLPTSVLTLSNAFADITVPLNPARSGQAHLRVSVQDDGGTANGGVDTRTSDLTLTVTPVDHPPQLVLPIGSTNLTTAQVVGMGGAPLLLSLQGRFVDPDGDAVSYFLLDVQDPQNIVGNETQGGVAVTNTPSGPGLFLLLNSNVTGTATVEYLAIANGLVSTNSDILTLTISSNRTGVGVTLVDPSAFAPPGLMLFGKPQAGGFLQAIPTGLLRRGALVLRWEVCDNDLWIGARPIAGQSDVSLYLSDELRGRFVRAVAVVPATRQDFFAGQEVVSDGFVVGDFPASFDQWRLHRFSSVSLQSDDPAASDPDGDGLSNLAEYAFGTDPLSADPPPGTASLDYDDDGQPIVRLQYVAMKGRQDVTIEVETSPDLLNWTTETTAPEILRQAQWSAQFSYRLPTTDSARFWRLQVRRTSSFGIGSQ